MATAERKPGSFAAQHYQAKCERLEALSRSFDEPHPDVARLFIAVSAALHHSATLAKLTRSTDPVRADAFIAHFVRLEVFLEWLKNRSEIASLDGLWPKDPGCTFALKAGSSAMDVIWTFAESVRNACIIARAMERVSTADGFWDDQPIHPEPSQPIINWSKFAMEELRSHIIPPDHVWPVMGHIHRDHGSMIHKLRDEYTRARTNAAQRHIDLQRLATEIVDGIDRYAAFRKALFLQLAKLKESKLGWKIQYKRDPAEGDPTAPARVIHQTGTIDSIGDVQLIDNIATFKHSESYAPFHDFDLLDPWREAAG